MAPGVPLEHPNGPGNNEKDKPLIPAVRMPGIGPGREYQLPGDDNHLPGETTPPTFKLPDQMGNTSGQTNDDGSKSKKGIIPTKPEDTPRQPSA